MLFNSWEFLVFLPVVLALYYLLAPGAQNRMLLVASYVFYASWDWRFVSLLMLSTVTDYYLSLAIHTSASQQRRRRILIFSLVVNFGMLGVFKYYNFFVDSAAQALEWLGFQANLPALRIILPAGISFYTFQTMNYTIDVYRRHLEPTRDFLTYALFVSYFPHLVAGPIIRADVLLPQLQRPRIVTSQHLRSGAVLILFGLFKKIAIADTLAPYVEQYFSAPTAYSSAILLKGLYFFSLQIYCDFSGYTDVARGVSRLLGIDLPENFNQPYFSRTLTEFWRRWHISLSTWLRDYLYIPLGGNRRGSLMTYRNLFLTMMLGGLWHGASWTFVVWGCLHGVYLALEKWLTGLFPNGFPGASSRLVTALRICLTFHLVALTWIFFRAPTFHLAFAYLMGILQGHGSWQVQNFARPALYALVVAAIDLPQYLNRDHTVILRARWWLRGTVYAAMFIAILLSRTGHAIPFIYFQF